MNSRIICIGNRLVPADSSGPAVFDTLQKRILPEGVELIEGGTAGLNLLPLLERGGRVIFVDSVSGFTCEGGIVVLESKTIIDNVTAPSTGHDVGLPYLLAVLPQVCEKEMPEEVVLVGLEGECNKEIIERAADISVSLAVNGL